MQQLKEKRSAPANLNATVAAVVNTQQVVINKGAEDGIAFGQRFTLYELSDQDIIDPTTNESLGRLETIKGTGKIVHIQDKLSILEAIPESELLALFATPPRSTFKDPKVGDKARPI